LRTAEKYGIIQIIMTKANRKILNAMHRWKPPSEEFMVKLKKKIKERKR
jgi:hypothetical protein